ncbi:MAG: ABC transporter ATP-binding protein/permease [Spirochaetales bacterium]|jgi:ATP-binding cassette subfamily B protein|nr:ABC transporter ATP-binding protein/permease [Spirochaetales bacterium]
MPMLKEIATLFPYFRRYKFRYLAGFMFLAVASGGQMLIPQILRQAVDIMSAGNFESGVIAVLFRNLLAVAVCISAARFGWRYFIHGSSRRIETELRGRLFRHLLALHAGFFAGQKTGELMARSTNDMYAVRMASGMALVALADGVFMTLAILVILFRQAASLTWYIILPLPLITLLIIMLGTVVGKRFKKVQDVFASLSGQTQESISGIRVIKSFVKEKYFLKKFGAENEAYLRANIDLVRLWGLFHPGITFLSGLTGVLLLYFGGKAVLAGTLSPGLLLAVFSYLEMLIWPMIGAGFTVNMLQRGAAALGRINAVLNEKPAIVSRPAGRKGSPGEDLSVHDLCFRYEAGLPPVLEDVGFEIPAGKTLGILGRTGSGKTSLVSLLPRIYDPPRGTIFLGGTDILDYELSSLRKTFGIVPQETFLFSASISGNIAFGAEEELPEEKLAALAEISTISRDAKLFPQGLATQIGERGITLSGGQKQRVAISRALAGNPHILILDDALSSVDTQTEEKILAGVLEYRRGKTNIIISHRIRALSFCDNIIVLEKGRVSQRGSHAELLARPGLYKDIHTLQITGEQGP